MYNLFQYPVLVYLTFSLIFAFPSMNAAEDLGWDPVLGIGLGL